MAIEDFQFEWIPGPDVTEAQIRSCADLFSDHYAIWGQKGKYPGKRVTLPPSRLRELLSAEGAWAAFAKLNSRLIAYAFALRATVPDKGVVTWVTQLVVEDQYRNQGVAKKLLHNIWGFSDHFAWGLVTASPYAVRAFEKATRRRCDLHFIRPQADRLYELGCRCIPYISGHKLSVRWDKSVINTDFYIDHSDLLAMLNRVQQSNSWQLGPINEGQEWFAFTFRDQEEFPLASEELSALLADADKTAIHAYRSMRLDNKHHWQRHTESEVDFILAHLSVRPGAAILDFGCGNGRHSLELARRGYQVVGVDFVDTLILQAKDLANRENLHNAHFLTADCRDFQLQQKFDACICLYDVVGTFPNQDDNVSILTNLSRVLKREGKALISVLNMESAWQQAKHKITTSQLQEALLALKPSAVMQNSGQIFDPNHYIIDSETHIVYRKEQFEGTDFQLPSELIIRDRRYRWQELVDMCTQAGFREVWSRPVQAGRWSIQVNATDVKAKELLYLGEKI